MHKVGGGSNEVVFEQKRIEILQNHWHFRLPSTIDNLFPPTFNEKQETTDLESGVETKEFQAGVSLQILVVYTLWWVEGGIEGMIRRKIEAII